MNAVKVEPAVIEAAIKEYTAIRDELVTAYTKSDPLVKIKGPGKDRPSEVYALAANKVGRDHLQANLDLRTAIEGRISLLQATLDQYRQTDQGNASDLKPKD
ncbi:PE domain-containing protein [Umezawaea sp. NPDC059074]|uniref:PE domain-containing protein n=1 Tax=Umezawaea sp. NPDC059074 TaxID=3346716 RepID=UPI0036881D73